MRPRGRARAAPLAAGENGDRLLVLVPAGKEEAAEQRLRLRARQVRRALGRLEHGVPLVELDFLLREVADGDAVAQPHAPSLWFALVEHGLDQRRLPGAVRPDERDVLAALGANVASRSSSARRSDLERVRLDDRPAAARRIDANPAAWCGA
jgi:hypothetical protein